jgi:citrate-Mg2+:H+ or citrate-Ca2+:H+ symporter, CitMHS family
MGEWQKYEAKWSLATFIIFVLAAVLTGVMPL